MRVSILLLLFMEMRSQYSNILGLFFSIINNCLYCAKCLWQQSFRIKISWQISWGFMWFENFKIALFTKKKKPINIQWNEKNKRYGFIMYCSRFDHFIVCFWWVSDIFFVVFAYFNNLKSLRGNCSALSLHNVRIILDNKTGQTTEKFTNSIFRILLLFCGNILFYCKLDIPLKLSSSYLESNVFSLPLLKMNHNIFFK